MDGYVCDACRAKTVGGMLTKIRDKLKGKKPSEGSEGAPRGRTEKEERKEKPRAPRFPYVVPKKTSSAPVLNKEILSPSSKDETKRMAMMLLALGKHLVLDTAWSYLLIALSERETIHFINLGVEKDKESNVKFSFKMSFNPNKGSYTTIVTCSSTKNLSVSFVGKQGTKKVDTWRWERKEGNVWREAHARALSQT